METTKPASKRRVVPCPKCGAKWPIVQALWVKEQGKPKRLVCCCTHCGIEGTIVEKKKPEAK